MCCHKLSLRSGLYSIFLASCRNIVAVALQFVFFIIRVEIVGDSKKIFSFTVVLVKHLIVFL